MNVKSHHHSEDLRNINSENQNTAGNSDSKLLKSITTRLAQGEQYALEQLYLMLQDHFSKFITAIVRSPEDAFDITQEIYIYIWENREKFAAVNNIKSYMYSIARTHAFRFLRNRAAERGNPSLDDFPMPQISDIAPDDILIADETRVLIAMALDAMSDEKKAIFELKRFEKLSYGEIAEKLDMNKRTVEKYMGQITSELRRVVMLFVAFVTSDWIIQ